jgi:hypothetical protein
LFEPIGIRVLSDHFTFRKPFLAFLLQDFRTSLRLTKEANRAFHGSKRIAATLMDVAAQVSQTVVRMRNAAVTSGKGGATGRATMTRALSSPAPTASYRRLHPVVAVCMFLLPSSHHSVCVALVGILAPLAT